MSLTTKRVAALAASAPQEQGSHGDLDYSLASGGTPGGPSLAAQVRFKTKDTEVAVDVSGPFGPVAVVSLPEVLHDINQPLVQVAAGELAAGMALDAFGLEPGAVAI